MSLSKQNNFNSLTFSAQLPQFTPRSVRSLLLSLTGVNKAILGEGTQGQYNITLYRLLILIPAGTGRRKTLTMLRSNQFYRGLVATTQQWDETRNNPLRARQALLCAIGQSKQIPPIKLGVMIHTYLHMFAIL